MILPVGERKKSFHPQDTDSPFINRYSLDSGIPILYPAEPSFLFYYRSSGSFLPSPVGFPDANLDCRA